MGKVPDTNSFSMQDVVNAGVAGDDLVELFANANPNGFDPAYVGDKTNLLNFRNYNNEPAVDLPYTHNWADGDDGNWLLEGGAQISSSLLQLIQTGGKATININQTENKQVTFSFSHIGNSGTLHQEYNGVGTTGSANPAPWTPPLQPVGINPFFLESYSGGMSYSAVTIDYFKPPFPADVRYVWRADEGSGGVIADPINGGNLGATGNQANVWEASGKNGSAIKNVGGSNDYWEAIPKLNFVPGAISFWYKNGGVPTGTNWLINNCAGGSSVSKYGGWNIQINGTPNLIYMQGNNNGGVASSSRRSHLYTDPNNWAGSYDWIHIVVNILGLGVAETDHEIYYNGIKQTRLSESGSATGMVFDTNSKCRFLNQIRTDSATTPAYNPNPDSMALDEIYYWARALTAQEVLDLYNEGNGNFYE